VPNPTRRRASPHAREAGAITAVLLLTAFSFLVNVNGLFAFFVGDDFDFLRLVAGVRGFAGAMSLEFWGEWEPLWWVTFYRDYRIWGWHALGYHLDNVLWLAVGVVALRGIVRELWPEARLAAWAAPLLFAAHPLHDEAVTYLAARGHPMGTALAFVALWMWARARAAPLVRPAGIALAAGAIVAAFLAGLAKEIALTLPAWVAAAEWGAIGRDRGRSRAVGRGLAAGAAFCVPAVATLVARWLVVGFEAGKLRGPDGPAALLDRLGSDLPSYALLGGLPIPFAFLDDPVVERFALLGWALAVAIALAAVAAAAVALGGRTRRFSGAWDLCLLGLVIATTSLAPVVWADLGVRRRYLFTPSAGAVLVTAALLQVLASRRPRLAVGLLVAGVALGSAGLVQRNELYRGAGHVTRSLVETVRRAPLGQSARRGAGGVALITLPRYWGGDGLSGAYVLHRTDLSSALTIAGARQRARYALECTHSDD
jgi:hypothetical protein